MAEAVSRLTDRGLDRMRLAPIADWLAVGVAIALPWSISISQILTVLWLIAVVPTLEVGQVRRELRSAAGGLPVLLWLLAVIGMVWANAPWSDRLGGLEGFDKLLVIPLLLAQFRRSERGVYVLGGFLVSCTVLMLASWVLLALWHTSRIYVPGKLPGMLVKDYIAQSTEFLICAFALLGFMCERWRGLRPALMAGAIALAFLFLANIFYIATGRTTLVVMPLLLFVLGFRYFGWRGIITALAAAVVIACVAWAASPLLRERMTLSISEVRNYEAGNSLSPTGLRLELAKKSLEVIATAPLFGHGTGAIPAQFSDLTINATNLAANNPHNQIFAVAVQLGLIGTAILVAMWVAHLLVFRGPGLISWIGIVVVLQNFASAPFNAHLFDSLHGWLYAFGFGVVGGMALRQRDRTEP